MNNELSDEELNDLIYYCEIGFDETCVPFTSSELLVALKELKELRASRRDNTLVDASELSDR